MVAPFACFQVSGNRCSPAEMKRIARDQDGNRHLLAQLQYGIDAERNRPSAPTAANLCQLKVARAAKHQLGVVQVLQCGSAQALQA